MRGLQARPRLALVHWCRPFSRSARGHDVGRVRVELLAVADITRKRRPFRLAETALPLRRSTGNGAGGVEGGWRTGRLAGVEQATVVRSGVSPTIFERPRGCGIFELLSRREFRERTSKPIQTVANRLSDTTTMDEAAALPFPRQTIKTAPAGLDGGRLVGGGVCGVRARGRRPAGPATMPHNDAEPGRDNTQRRCQTIDN